MSDNQAAIESAQRAADAALAAVADAQRAAAVRAAEAALAATQGRS